MSEPYVSSSQNPLLQIGWRLGRRGGRRRRGSTGIVRFATTSNKWKVSTKVAPAEEIARVLGPVRTNNARVFSILAVTLEECRRCTHAGRYVACRPTLLAGSTRY
jgi:hypothetical protein